MRSYVIRYKKLTDENTNNYRKLHDKPMKRWRHIIKFRDEQITRADRRRNARLRQFADVMVNDVYKKYKKWMEDGKPGPEISEYLDNIDISREMEFLKEAGYEDDAK